MAGFTTVRDLGDNGVNSIALRKAINQGWVPGPRIFTSGKSLATTGGHADPTNALRGDYRRDPGPLEGVINGAGRRPQGGPAALQGRRGPDQAHRDRRRAQPGGQRTEPAVHRRGAARPSSRRPSDYDMIVAVHAHGTEGIKRAVLAGVDSIEHGTFMTDEIDRADEAEGHVLGADEHGRRMGGREGQGAGLLSRRSCGPRRRRSARRSGATFAKAHAAGVKIAFGTDSGVSPHGENAREFELMVAGGMPPMKAIQSATLRSGAAAARSTTAWARSRRRRSPTSSPSRATRSTTSAPCTTSSS